MTAALANPPQPSLPVAGSGGGASSYMGAAGGGAAQHAAQIASQGNVTVANNTVMWINTSAGTASSGLHIPVNSGTISTNGSMFTITGGTAQTINHAMQQQMLAQLNQAHQNLMMRADRMKLSTACKLELPDGTLVDVQADGSYQILDADAKIKYKGNPLREFNRYVNASDLLEEFVDFVASVGGINKEGFLGLPVELFIRWLVIRAAEADGDEAPEDEMALKAHPALLPAPTAAISYRNCKCCGRFVTRKKADHGMLFCNAEHFKKFEEALT
jgi:hypothetical protein